MSSTARLLHLLKGVRWWILATAALASTTFGSGIGLIALAVYLISRAALVDSTATLALAITGVRFFAVCRAASRYLERYVGHLGTFKLLTSLRVRFFRGIEPLAPARLQDRRSGDLLDRILADVDSLQDAYLRVVVPALAAAFGTLTVTLVLGSFSVALGLSMVVFLVLVGAVLPACTRLLGRSHATGVAAMRSEVQATAVEGLSGVAELVAWGRRDLLSDAIAQRTLALHRIERRLTMVRAMATSLTSLVVGAATMTILMFAIALVGRGELDGVYLAMMPLVAIAAFEAVQPLSEAMEHLDRSRAATDRLHDLIDEDVSVTDPCDPIPVPRGSHVGIRIRGLTFSYPESPEPVLHDLSFDIGAGSHVGITGPSGSGKSTILALFLRFWDYHQGSILLDGSELRRCRAAQTRRLFAAVAQGDHLFDTTVRDNLLLAAADAGEDRLNAALEDACASEVVLGLTHGLDSRVGQNAARLSGGERQRLLIARALLLDAPILVLDEATAHLDPDLAGEVLQRVLARPVRQTVIVISHDADRLVGMETILHLEQGRVTATR